MPKPDDDQEVAVQIGIALESSAAELSDIMGELRTAGFKETGQDESMVCVTGSIPSQKVSLIEEIAGVSWVRRL